MDQPSKHDQRRALFFRRWLYWVLITTLVPAIIIALAMRINMNQNDLKLISAIIVKKLSQIKHCL